MKPALENYVFSTPDLVYDLSKWRVGDFNVLYVTGLSGSGKSTIAAQLAAENNAYHIELDLINNCVSMGILNRPVYKYNEKDCEMLNAYYHIHPFKDPQKMNDDEYNEHLCAVFDYMATVMHNDRLHLYVVEGIQLITLARDGYGDEIFNSPLIIKNTSVLSSALRRCSRYKGDVLRVMGNDSKKLSIANLRKFLTWYADQERSLKFFRRDARKYARESFLLDDDDDESEDEYDDLIAEDVSYGPITQKTLSAEEQQKRNARKRWYHAHKSDLRNYRQHRAREQQNMQSQQNPPPKAQ